MPPRSVIEPGDRFGRLTAVRPVGRGGATLWKCACSCGNSKFVTQKSLDDGTRSCGCIAADVRPPPTSNHWRERRHLAANGSQNIAAGSNALNWCPVLEGPAEPSALRA